VEDIGRIRDAKIFLASRIAEEADRGGIPFSETERKMLYDSTGGWTLPDIEEVREAFRREHVRSQYEEKTASLIRRARARLRAAGGDDYDDWTRSIAALRGGGHYLRRLIAGAQPEGEIARLIITAIVVLGVIAIAIFLINRGY
jgi:hypothetical protein